MLMSFNWKHPFKKEEKLEVVPITKDEEIRVALKKLQELKMLWSFLLNRYTTKALRQTMRKEFVYDDGFGPKLIEDTIEFYKEHLEKK